MVSIAPSSAAARGGHATYRSERGRSVADSEVCAKVSLSQLYPLRRRSSIGQRRFGFVDNVLLRSLTTIPF